MISLNKSIHYVQPNDKKIETGAKVRKDERSVQVICRSGAIFMKGLSHILGLTCLFLYTN